MWYCPWPVHTCNLHMIPPYAGCGSVAFPPTWGTLSQCYSTHWAEQQCGYLCLNPVLSSIPAGVGGLAGFCRALEGVSNSGVFQGIPLVSPVAIVAVPPLYGRGTQSRLLSEKLMCVCTRSPFIPALRGGVRVAKHARQLSLACFVNTRRWLGSPARSH